MLGISKASRAFNILMLEEGEVYIKDFYGTASFHCFITNAQK